MNTFKRLSPEEMAERRKLGLCYNCDEPYVRGHKCARLFYLEAQDYIVEEPDDDDEGDSPAPADATEPFDPEKPMISLSAITGIRAPATMQLRVRCGGQDLVALLDSGSTHNFISGAAASRTGLAFGDSKGAHVVVANGDRVACRGLARRLPIQVGGEEFYIDCYSIPLDAYDMVLGISWLTTLGPILWDFEGCRMAFHRRGRRVLWTGMGAPSAVPSLPRHLHSLVAAKESEADLLERLLASFDDVFAPPIGLPPARPCDHQIHLKVGTDPVAVRPYRYPQL